MYAKFINAINENGNQTAFQIRGINGEYAVIQYNQTIVTANDEESAMNAVLCMMVDNGWHTDNIVINEDGSWHAFEFNPVDDGRIIVKFYEWTHGQYIQLGPEEYYDPDCARAEYGYC